MTQQNQPVKIVVWVVWRWTDWEEQPLERRLTVNEILSTKEEADTEAARLNELVADRADTRYFVQPGRYYPDGRGVEKGY
ncbi:MAG: hypothetical protein GY788_03485 [bacterium]|nr:hypothetical protein [bacterium]